jgi:hypothetical protein
LTLLAAALRLHGLGDESFWYDETWTVLEASKPISAVLRMVNPLPHLAAHLSLWLGRSESVLRMGPAFAGVLLIPASYRLGRTLYGRMAGLIAASLLTVSTYAIYHSQELRFYAWQMLFSTLTLYFLLRGLERGRWIDWTGFTLTTMLNLYSSPFALLVLASQGLYAMFILFPEVVLSARGRPVPEGLVFPVSARRMAAPAAAALVALVAFGPGWRHLIAHVESPHWAIEAADAAATTALSGTPSLSTPIATWTYELPSRLMTLKHPLLLLGMFAFFFIGLLSSSRRLVALVLVWFLVPPIVLFLVKVRFYHRYLSYFLPLFTIVVAHGINYVAAMLPVRQQRRWLVIALLTVLVVTPSLAQLPEYYQVTQKAQWREVVSFVEDNRQHGDIALVTLNAVVGAANQPFDWYRTLPDSELPWQFFPEDGNLTNPQQLSELPVITRHYQRVWFILPAATIEMEEMMPEVMSERFRLVQEHEFVHLRVLLYESMTSGRLPMEGSRAELLSSRKSGCPPARRCTEGYQASDRANIGFGPYGEATSDRLISVARRQWDAVLADRLMNRETAAT